MKRNGGVVNGLTFNAQLTVKLSIFSRLQSLINQSSAKLLRAERLHRFDGRGAAGGDDRCRDRKQQNEDSRKCEDGRIDRVDLEQQRTQQVGGKDSTDRSDPAAGQSEFRARNRISRMTLERCAPSARRMAISWVRSAAEKAMTL